MLDDYVIFVLGVAMPIVITEFQIQPDVAGLIEASLGFGAVIGFPGFSWICYVRHWIVYPDDFGIN